MCVLPPLPATEPPSRSILFSAFSFKPCLFVSATLLTGALVRNSRILNSTAKQPV